MSGIEQYLKIWGSKAASLTGYPLPVRAAINRLPVDVHIEMAPDVTVRRDSRLEGTVRLDCGATIASGCFIRGSVTLNDAARVGKGSTLNGDINVGKRTNLVEKAEAIGDVRFGRYDAIARRCTFQGLDHFVHRPGIQMKFYREVVGEQLEHVSKGPIEVGNDVWVGADVTVLSGVTIGDGAVVGARSVVTSDVEPYAVVAGVPAERKDWRFDEPVRDQLRDIAWWEWSDERIERNKSFFTTDLREVEDIYALIE